MFNFIISNQKLNRLVLVAKFLSLTAAFGIFFPTYSGSQRSLVWHNHVHAQEYTPREIRNYARAGFQVEVLRQQTYQEIKSIVNQAPPPIVCDRSETMRNIPSNIRGIANNYCNQTHRIVRQNNLSFSRFNQLKNRYDRRGSFYQEVQQQLLQIQK